MLERKSCISGTEGRRDSGTRLACSAGPNYGGRVKLPSVSDVRFGSYETFVRKKYTLLERKSCISGTEGRRDSGQDWRVQRDRIMLDGSNFQVSPTFGSGVTRLLLERNILC